MPRLGIARAALGTLFLVRTTALGRLVHLPGPPDGIPLLGWPAVGGRFPFQTFAHLSDRALEGACVARTVAALLFTVGLWTRPAGFVAAALGYLVASQNPPAFTMTMHLFLLGMIVLACTDAAAELAIRPRPQESPISSVGLVRVWTASIYVWAGVAKLNRDWLSGRVLGVWIDDHVVRTEAAAALIGTAKQRALIAPAVPIGELTLGALLLFRPTRRPALLAALVLHAVFEVTIAPDMFGWAMAALLVAFVGDIGPWREVFAKRPRLPAAAAPLAMLALAACLAGACSAQPDPSPGAASCVDPLVLDFVPDTAGAAEAYVCFGFDAGALGAATIQSVVWSPPSVGGPFILHHAKIYAAPATFPSGPVSCDGMPPGALGLHVWAPGGTSLVLPSDTGLVLPAGTTSLVVEAHTLKVGTGTPRGASVTLCKGPSVPTNLAALMPVVAPVPAIRPLTIETSESSCTLAGDLHLFSVWPHMHLLGKEVEVDWLGPTDGGSTPLVDVTPWNFNVQATYPLDLDVTGGTNIRIRCVWNNTTDSYVFPGPRTEDEMCQAAFIAWPATAASCAL